LAEEELRRVRLAEEGTAQPHAGAVAVDRILEWLAVRRVLDRADLVTDKRSALVTRAMIDRISALDVAKRRISCRGRAFCENPIKGPTMPVVGNSRYPR